MEASISEYHEYRQALYVEYMLKTALLGMESIENENPKGNA